MGKKVRLFFISIVMVIVTTSTVTSTVTATVTATVTSTVTPRESNLQLTSGNKRLEQIFNESKQNVLEVQLVSPENEPRGEWEPRVADHYGVDTVISSYWGTYLDFIHYNAVTDELNNEAKTYLADTFYKHGENAMGWHWTKEVLELNDTYPELFFLNISNVITGMMGIEPDAPNNKISTIPRLTKEVPWVQVIFSIYYGCWIG